ncbi:MAG: hypothetical protein WC527_00240 [Candidatus Margulisiibacteriota bacterium]
MLRKISIAFLVLSAILVGHALAIGPAELTIYGGPTVSNYSGGYDLGASVLVNLPMIPKVGVEAERSALVGNVNITRLGLVYEQSVIPFLASFKLSAGSSSISSNGSFTIGSHTFAASATENGSYVTAGLVVKVLSLVVNPKYVYNQYGGVSVSEGIINAGMSF